MCLASQRNMTGSHENSNLRPVLASLLSSETYPKTRLLPKSALGNHVCFRLVGDIRTACSFTVSSLLFEFLYWKVFGLWYPWNQSKSDCTCYWHCAGSVELACFVLPMQVFTKRKRCLLWRCLVLWWCSTWDESHRGVECEAFPFLIVTLQF